MVKSVRFLAQAFTVALFLILSAKVDGAPPGTPPEDSRFVSFQDRFIELSLDARPARGTALGLHKYDGRIVDTSFLAIQKEIQRLNDARSVVGQFHQEMLSPQNAFDLQILRQAIDSELFTLVDIQPFKLNPIIYARTLDVSIYIKRAFAPLPDRVRSIIAIENRAHDLFVNARANLAPVLARPLIQVAVQAADGSAEFLAREVAEALASLINEDPTLYAQFVESNNRAVGELRSYARWLEKERLPTAQEQFAIGREEYVKMLQTSEMISLSPEELLSRGLHELEQEQARFAKAAKEIEPANAPIETFKLIQRDHPTAESLLPDARKNLEAIRTFLLDHHIITMPSEVRVRVEETPQFDRASSFASMDTPGPFETHATEAYYYVTPTEKNWPEKQKEEWLTAFNFYTTDIVSIHEAYPGHYTQYLHLNASPASRVEKIFTSYAFSEGWAHYCEQMMIEEGFGRTAGGLVGAKYRLAQADEALLRLCRLCVSIKMHCQGMSLQDGARFFRENCYYEDKPAYQEALRGTFDPGYLFYTVGKLEILKLRDDWRQQEGTAYSLERFHEALLNHGAPPVRLLREQLLKNPKMWNDVL
jgi:uncharacterized protein (DUF885 family)